MYKYLSIAIYSMIRIVIVFICAVQAFALNIPCDFPEYEIPLRSKSKQVYIMRNKSIHPQFNKLFTIKNMVSYLKNKPVFSMEPYHQPSIYKRVNFTTFIRKHFTAYEKRKMKSLLKNPYTRMLYPHFNSTTPIIPPEILKYHSCDYVKHFGLKRNWDFFISAKGQSANFHAHDEIFTQIVSGEKLWLIANNLHDLHDIGIRPNETPSMHIRKLIRDKRIKKCVAKENDIIHIPTGTMHAMFNIKNTLAASCIILNHRKTFERAIDGL